MPGVSWGLEYPHWQGPSQAEVDSIVVLAGGQREDGSVPPWVERRLDAALDLHKQADHKPPILLLGSGTPHKPPILNERGYVVHEAVSCAQYLAQRGLSTERMLKEVSSYDTVGNAFFSLTIHALPAGWRRIAVVTSDFHMPRTASLFRRMYALAGEAFHSDPARYELLFVGVSDEGLFPGEVLDARKAREAHSLAAWEATAQRLASFRELHQWLHETHLCYAVSRMHEFGQTEIKDPRVLASY